MAKANFSVTTPFHVTTNQANMFSRLRLGALVDMLIQSAIKSADGAGFGINTLKAEGLTWVLSRLTIEIYEPSEIYDTLEIETWPKNIERKVIFYRDYVVRNKEGKIIAKGTSNWLSIDGASKRPKPISNVQYYEDNISQDISALDAAPERLGATTEGEESHLKSTFYDIDLNGHVTSSRYIDWMMDTFSTDFHKENTPKHLSINYMNEVTINKNITIRKNKIANEYLFEAVNGDSANTAYRGKIGF
jgi:medium-chain acyl-[acyl-carrier-protein] hydrolase